MKVLKEGGWVENNMMKLNINNNTFEMTIYELALQGKHNLNNSMAAGISGSILNLRKEGIRECLSDFQGVEHRLERFLRVHNIEFINDSKATNINSVWYALESMSTPVVWIVGGIDKGNDYSMLYDLVKAKVKAIVCLGKDRNVSGRGLGDSRYSGPKQTGNERVFRLGCDAGPWLQRWD